MLNIEKTDFRTLEEFPLKWRWTDARWSKLPEDALQTIRPFASAKAEELLQYSLKFCDYTGLSESIFENISRIDASGNSLEIKQWLLNHFSDKNQRVIVLWNYHTAVMVRWDTFCDYWDTFCYPASDDVIVWNLSENWVLVYLHDENFVFGIKKNNE